MQRLRQRRKQLNDNDDDLERCYECLVELVRTGRHDHPDELDDELVRFNGHQHRHELADNDLEHAVGHDSQAAGFDDHVEDDDNDRQSDEHDVDDELVRPDGLFRLELVHDGHDALDDELEE